MKRAALVMAVEVLLPLRNECEGDGGMKSTQLSVSRMLNLSGRDSNGANDCDGGVCVKRQTATNGCVAARARWTEKMRRRWRADPQKKERENGIKEEAARCLQRWGSSKG